MKVRGRTFEVDRTEGKFLGVCAGIARLTGLDPIIVRIGVVLLAVTTSFTWTAVAYFAAALIGYRRNRTEQQYARISDRGDREESRERVRNLDLRMQAIETYVTSSNSRLAREIEDLR